MIVTLTPNPSLDRTLHVDPLRHGEVNRVLATLTEPSGKGVNVSLALHQVGSETVAVLPVGGASGTALVALLEARNLGHRSVEINGAVRSNVSVVESDGTTTKLNESGPHLDDREVRRLISTAVETVSEGDWLAVCGSWPAGFGLADLVETIGRARDRGAQVAVDTSGDALRAVVNADTLPQLIKPNTHELAELAGRSLHTLGDVADAGRELIERGLGTVLISLGGDGGMLLDRDATGAWGHARVDRIRNTAGAGDAFLAGYLCVAGARNDSSTAGARGLASALRFGASAVTSAGTLFSELDSALEIELGEIDRHRELSEPAVLR